MVHKLQPLIYYVEKGFSKYSVENLKSIPEDKRKEIIEFITRYKKCFFCGDIKDKTQTPLKTISKGVVCPDCFNSQIYTDYVKGVRDKAKETTFKRLGVEYASQSPLIKAKVKQTNLDKWGYESPSQSPLIKAKVKQTKKERYGDENYCNIDKHKRTIKERYNVDNISQIPDVRRRNSKSKTKLKNVSEGDVEKYKRGELGGKPIIDLDNFLKDYDATFITGRKFLKSLGWDYLTHTRGKSKDQEYVFSMLGVENKQINCRSILPWKELDIFLPDFNLAIEFDGLMYHSQGVSKYEKFNTPNFDKNYHLQKTLECNSLGIQLLHIFEGEDIDLWLSMINSKLGLNTRIYARNCCAVELRNSDLREFLDENHLQGFCNASVAMGLFLQESSKEAFCDAPNRLVAGMTFSKPRFSKGYDYELVRFCSLKGHSIIGGASKLWKFFLKKYAPKSVISYANLRFSNGGLYENLGFSLKHRSEPNYYYFKPNEGILHTRNKFQKHKQPSLLEIYDSDKSEVENMFANGYRRIFDCGNLVYEWVANS